MIRRKSPAVSETPAEAPDVPKSGGKGRPTPKRREAEARNKRPLVVNDRREAKRIAKQRRQELWQKQREAMRTGDERYLPQRDRGRVRRYVRDYVDARWCIAEFFLPFALLMLVAMMFVGVVPELANSIILGTYGLLLVSIIDSFVMAQVLKRRLRKRFDQDEIPRFTGMYAATRSFYFRRMRQPKPQVKRGEYPA